MLFQGYRDGLGGSERRRPAATSAILERWRRMEEGGSPRTAAGRPVTPDGRYFVVDGRLWRLSDPSLTEARRKKLVEELMTARRAVGSAKRAGDDAGLVQARHAVDRAKRSLGERGPVWWDDGVPDLNRHMVAGTPYARWFVELGGEPSDPRSGS